MHTRVAEGMNANSPGDEGVTQNYGYEKAVYAYSTMSPCCNVVKDILCDVKSLSSFGMSIHGLRVARLAFVWLLAYSHAQVWSLPYCCVA
jgi:hypothetical protein